MSDDWGCNIELFGETTTTGFPSQTLVQLVDCLAAKKDETSKIALKEKFYAPNPPLPNDEVQVFPCANRKKPVHSAPKILKKKSKNSIGKKENNVKRVTFEVEQLLAREAAKDDREKAKERLVQSLGGLPSKKTYVNYKQLKGDLALRKAEALKVANRA